MKGRKELMYKVYRRMACNQAEPRGIRWIRKGLLKELLPPFIASIRTWSSCSLDSNLASEPVRGILFGVVSVTFSFHPLAEWNTPGASHSDKVCISCAAKVCLATGGIEVVD
jgi:hypothetical protein